MLESRHMERRRRHLARARRRRRLLLALTAAALLLLAALAAASLMSGDEVKADSSGASVLLIPVEGVIDSRMADFVIRNIEAAETGSAAAVMLQLDTPGGFEEPMRDIIKKMANSPLPVVAYVYPSGARAASAGTFIMNAADLAAMAPGTNLGASHPVAVGLDPSSPEGEKAVNDAAAYMRSLAEANGRNADWAELAVRQSVSASADEALSQRVIDMIANDPESLLADADGFTTVAKGITLETAGASIEQVEMSFWDRLAQLLLNPDVVFLLLLLGLIALAYEFAHPGIGVGAFVGFICLALAIYALTVLPVSFAGLALIVIGFALFAADLYVSSYGLLSIGGLISLLLGSYMLFDSSYPYLRVSLPLSIALALVTAGFFVIIVQAAVRARRLPAQTGSGAMIGATGHAQTRLEPAGQVHVRGEIWSAESCEGDSIERGEEIEVVEVSGLLLKVRPLG